MKKTSWAWRNEPEYINTIIYDADGWDRKNYKYSFFKELITKEEFEQRLAASTIMYKDGKEH